MAVRSGGRASERGPKLLPGRIVLSLQDAGEIFWPGYLAETVNYAYSFAPDNTGTRSSQCLVSYRTHFRRPSTYGAVISGVIIRKIFPIFIIIFPSY